MEAWIFGVFSGLWLAMLFVAIGVIIGKVHSYYHQKPHKDDAEHVRDRNNHSDVHSGGTDNVHDSLLGDDNREEHHRCDVGLYFRGRIQADGAITILENVKREMKNMLSGSEIDAIDYAIECTRVRAELLEMIEEVRNS